MQVYDGTERLAKRALASQGSIEECGLTIVSLERILVSMDTNVQRENPDNPATGLEKHLGYWLRRVSNHVSSGFAAALGERDVSVAEWVALSRIEECAETRAADLANAMRLTKGAVSKILDKLEQKNWVKRAGLASDNRVQLVSLTAPGRKILPHLRDIADHNDERFFACLSAEEGASLRLLLRKLSDFHGIQQLPIE